MLVEIFLENKFFQPPRKNRGRTGLDFAMSVKKIMNNLRVQIIGIKKTFAIYDFFGGYYKENILVYKILNLAHLAFFLQKVLTTLFTTMSLCPAYVVFHRKLVLPLSETVQQNVFYSRHEGLCQYFVRVFQKQYFTDRIK